MTNAIEQSKREMYESLANLKGRIEINYSIKDMQRGADEFDSYLESYLELLRQDHEALHETSRKRFEDIQSLEAVNKDLIEQLGNMTERRDYFRNQVQASNHACKTQQDQSATPAQDSGDRASCAKLDGKTPMVLLHALVRIQDLISAWAVDGEKAKKIVREIAGTVNADPALMKAMNAVNFSWPDVKYPCAVPCRCGVNFVVKDPETLTQCMCGCVYKGAIRHIVRSNPTEKEKGIAPSPDTYAAWIINNTQCMHSFPSGEQCVFCGVGK
jgi:hypothetical protein